ncbi:MAG TPA: SpoIIE family protein phosphatase [Gaiellaceae bacterium]|jgi:serine phosphatase RsbU (regulator of sigma subunit)
MAVRTRDRGVARALDALADAARAAAQARGSGEALDAVAAAARTASGADVAIVRVLDHASGLASVRAVSAGSPALAALLEGSSLHAAELPEHEVRTLAEAPPSLAAVAERAGATALLLLPLEHAGGVVGTLELLRASDPFGVREQAYAAIAAAQAALVLRVFGSEPVARRPARDADGLGLAGDALALPASDDRAPERLLRLAAEAAGARTALLWREDGAGVRLVATHGPATAPADAAKAAVSVLRDGGAPALSATQDDALVTLRLGQPPLGVLQLAFPAASPPDDDALARLTTFAVRAAQALRVGERSRALESELERTRALLTVLGQAIAQLSLTHTLDTAVARIGELLDSRRVVVYLRDDDARLTPAAAARSLTGPHAAVAERLLELLLGPFRGRGVLAIADAASDERLRGQRDIVWETGIEAAVAVPLAVRDETIGLLAVYPPLGRRLAESETELLVALAGQLAVAVQNARLHEQAKELGTELEQALSAEREAAKQLRSLYEISRSFAQSLSLDATFDAVARTVVELLDADAAIIRVPDERREQLVTRALHVGEPRLAEALEPILRRPLPFGARAAQRLFRTREPLLVDGNAAAALGAPHELLGPFLEKGSTAAILPVATPAEVLGTLTLLSLDPERPISEATVETALSIAGQAALAIDNARLYQQQKEFADTMQRSLLPRSRPRIRGLEIGDVYAASARVDVGGDVYDYLQLPDGRLAVVVGDVTGHGIEAAADMAMAKFVFRSLARRHPEPGAFLAAANEVVVDEIAPGKFITMVVLTVDPETGAIAGAAAGHPPPRLVAPDGAVRGLEGHGLALGIDDAQVYRESREQLEPGAAVVLYTDGVIEARRGGELYGTERLDALLASRRALSARELARAVVDDCRAYAGGELVDDCAVVVLKRTP